VPQPEPLAQLRGVGVDYGLRRALDGVDLEVAPGALVVVVGPNGAGKTTLLRAIAGTVPITRGSIALEGRPLASMHRQEIARLVAVVPQEVHDAPGFSARDIVMMGRAPHQGRFLRASSRDEEIVTAALARCDAEALASRPFEELSGGERKRVMLAQALAQEPKVLLLDEPTAFLDLRHAIEVFELVRQEVARGLAVIATVHDLPLAARYGREALVLVGGAVHAVGACDEVMTEEILGAAFGVELVAVAPPGGHAGHALVPRALVGRE
jgi:iron complex transport system ATP-binding protein